MSFSDDSTVIVRVIRDGNLQGPEKSDSNCFEGGASSELTNSSTRNEFHHLLRHETTHVVRVQFRIQFLRFARIVHGEELDLATAVQLRQRQPKQFQAAIERNRMRRPIAAVKLQDVIR